MKTTTFMPQIETIYKKYVGGVLTETGLKSELADVSDSNEVKFVFEDLDMDDPGNLEFLGFDGWCG
jgi:hypothetical protein